MQVIFSPLEDILKRYLSDYDILEVKEAYEFAYEAHKIQVRKSGEPYIIHPVSVTKVLAEQCLPKKVLISALLHDVIEDTEYTYDDIKNRFGLDVANIVEGVTKLNNIQGLTIDQVQAANHHKIILAAAKDIRVILVKLADRVHNMRTINFMRDEKKKKIATETLEVYAPIAHRLGMYRIKWELEDLSFKCINREAFDDIVQKINMKRSERDAIVNEIVIETVALIDEYNMDASIYGRTKHIYSIYQKMQKSGKEFDELNDLFAFRIIVKSIPECYQVLGILHENYKPIPMRFKDYIPTPKHNLYQSIHTTLLTGRGIPIEFQIRTKEMDNVAEFGIASHWMYKSDADKEELQNRVNKQIEMLRHAYEDGENLESEKFMNTIKKDFFARNLIVYTPKGDVIEMPEKATALDFAYYLHTKIGNQAVSAKVNDRVVPLDTELEIGGVVYIITSKVAEPKVSSLQNVKTTRARDAIKKYFKEHEKMAIQKEGYTILKNELRKQNIDINLDEINNVEFEMLQDKLDVSSKSELFYAIGIGDLRVYDIIKLLVSIDHQVEDKLKSDIYIENTDKKATYRLCRYCSSIPGDEICATENKYKPNTYFVHRATCTYADTEIKKAYWNTEHDKEYVARIAVEIKDDKSVIKQIIDVLSKLNINITSIYLRAGLASFGIGRLSVELKDLDEYNLMKKELLKQPNVKTVERIIEKEK